MIGNSKGYQVFTTLTKKAGVSQNPVALALTVGQILYTVGKVAIKAGTKSTKL